jgi:hypothetical protein
MCVLPSEGEERKAEGEEHKKPHSTSQQLQETDTLACTRINNTHYPNPPTIDGHDSRSIYSLTHSYLIHQHILNPQIKPVETHIVKSHP